MKLLVTGASGFLGQYVVAEALRRGHQVRAVVRKQTQLPWLSHPSVELIRWDLQQHPTPVDALHGVDAVIHLAAAKQGDFDTQYGSTVVATEKLIGAMVAAKVLRLVAISSFSVFDYLSVPVGETINEDSPLEREPKQRDVYAQTKLLQENIIRDFQQKSGGQVTILRPGMVYGRDYLWNACLGVKVSDRLWIRIGGQAQMPLTYVENCADAIVAAAESPAAIGQTLNIVDDDLPTQNVYADKLKNLLSPSPYTIPISWMVSNLVAQTFWLGNKLLLAGKIKLPGILVPARLHARFKPLSYSNIRAQQVLTWQPKYSLDAALARSCSDQELLNVPPQTSQTSSISSQ
ncbi:NAD(P)-dependent oxidoreductase [Calothrix sp. PCC 7507]|uniref:NAD-dependent epimerase/dehydratase family protein n=1 Tax=Calothrix sp. PCC 7507 TaxID=99598 RepID=UPI00029F2F42|nr:NAD(P)-dependent oxidoreductase [Calothrix sp. PCC 7507]AFY35739.1 NAD-dependent epimerase/dehydratase [Calothrix sp. PCC 7507]